MFIGPILDITWTYSLGFIGGIFLPFINIAKHTRFFIISLILLLSLFTDNLLYIQILSFMRGLFIYNESKHSCELYFRFGFLVMDLFLEEYLMNYLFLGYLIIAVLLWEGKFHENERRQKNRGLQEPILKDDEETY